MTREMLIDLVVQIIEFRGSDDELSVLLEQLKQNVPHPTPTDLIFNHPTDLTPEEIVDTALSYKPIQL